MTFNKILLSELFEKEVLSTMYLKKHKTLSNTLIITFTDKSVIHRNVFLLEIECKDLLLDFDFEIDINTKKYISICKILRNDLVLYQSTKDTELEAFLDALSSFTFDKILS